jgi:uncharacterized protein DUF4157
VEAVAMHGHEHDFEDGQSLRPKGARVAEHEAGTAAKMAAGGRWDAAGASGLLDLQRTAGNAGVAAAMEEEQRSPVHDVINGGGKPLDADVRADMEGRLGADFGDVRVHDDSRAHDSAVAVNAHAYTVGSNVVFQRDRYDPSSDSGKLTLAHELTHVMQQRSGPVEGTAQSGGISVSHPEDRFEREAASNAERVMSAEPATVSAGPAADSVQREVVQREVVQREEAGEEEEEVQTLSADAPVQREEEEGEEEAEV